MSRNCSSVEEDYYLVSDSIAKLHKRNIQHDIHEQLPSQFQFQIIQKNELGMVPLILQYVGRDQIFSEMQLIKH